MEDFKIATFKHAYAFPFSVTTNRNAMDVTTSELRANIKKRLNALSDTELNEACELPLDAFYTFLMRNAESREQQTVAQLRDKGHAVVIFTPEELGHADR